MQILVSKQCVDSIHASARVSALNVQKRALLVTVHVRYVLLIE